MLSTLCPAQRYTYLYIVGPAPLQHSVGLTKHTQCAIRRSVVTRNQLLRHVSEPYRVFPKKVYTKLPMLAYLYGKTRTSMWKIVKFLCLFIAVLDLRRIVN